MVLLILEGETEEPKVMATIKQLFFSKNKEHLLCSYGTDTYTLWKDVRKYVDEGGEPDVFEIVRERLHGRGDTSLDGYCSYQFDSIYLFFDYDPQNSRVSPDVLNKAISDMVNLFSDPMDKGQIFISYPMTEALYCQDSLPDSNFVCSSVPVCNCSDFKAWIRRYECAVKRYMLLFKTDRSANIIEPVLNRRSDLRSAWVELVKASAEKANYICNGTVALPVAVDDVLQSGIFKGQLRSYLPKGLVAILSSYPMFLYEYFHGQGEF